MVIDIAKISLIRCIVKCLFSEHWTCSYGMCRYSWFKMHAHLYSTLCILSDQVGHSWLMFVHRTFWSRWACEWSLLMWNANSTHSFQNPALLRMRKVRVFHLTTSDYWPTNIHPSIIILQPCTRSDARYEQYSSVMLLL